MGLLDRFLLEHQSEQDDHMPLRVYDYVRSIWKKWLDQNPKPKTLPLVFPIIFHHGPSPWKAPRSLHKMIDGIDQVPAFAPYVPNVHLYLDDLHAEGNAALLNRPVPPALRVANFLFRDTRDQKALRAHSRVWLPFLQHVRPDHMTQLVSYIGKVAVSSRAKRAGGLIDGPEEVEFLETQAAKLAPKALPTMTTHAEHLRQEARHEATQQTLRHTLSVLLAERFGELDEPTKQRIDNASLEQLEQWVRRIIKAPTLESIFTD